MSLRLRRIYFRFSVIFFRAIHLADHCTKRDSRLALNCLSPRHVRLSDYLADRQNISRDVDAACHQLYSLKVSVKLV